jgi:predicted transcriptional regulator
VDSQNVTLYLSRQLVRRAKVVAARREISLSRMMTEALEQQVERDEGYEAARRRQLALLSIGLDLGFEPGDRDDLHVR